MNFTIKPAIRMTARKTMINKLDCN